MVSINVGEYSGQFDQSCTRALNAAGRIETSGAPQRAPRPNIGCGREQRARTGTLTSPSRARRWRCPSVGWQRSCFYQSPPSALRSVAVLISGSALARVERDQPARTVHAGDAVWRALATTGYGDHVSGDNNRPPDRRQCSLEPSVVQLRQQRPVVRHGKTGRGGVPDLSELTLEEQMVELDKGVRGRVGPVSGQ